MTDALRAIDVRLGGEADSAPGFMGISRAPPAEPPRLGRGPCPRTIEELRRQDAAAAAVGMDPAALEWLLRSARRCDECRRPGATFRLAAELLCDRCFDAAHAELGSGE